MNVTFWLTEKCNLNCKYCYVNKMPKTMSADTAKQTIDYFSDYFGRTVRNKKRINISLHGGEPLLNFDILQYVVERMKRDYGNSVRFMMTTNGTIFTEKIYDYLFDTIQVSISLDGNKKTNDRNRLYRNGASSFDQVMQTLQYIISQKQKVRIRMTVNKETIDGLADNYIFLDKLGAGVVTFSLDNASTWEKKDIDTYYDNYVEIMEYLLDKSQLEAQYFLYNIKEATFRSRNSCDGGTNTYHISSEGSIYPCSLAVENKELQLGNVTTGIDQSKLDELSEINSKAIVGCEQCAFRNNCSSLVCKIINKHYTGNYDTVIPFLCHERDVIYRIYRKYQYILEGSRVQRENRNSGN